MFTVLADRELEGPWGLFGGHPGNKAAYILHRNGQQRQLSSKTTVALEPNDTISYRTCGGGGYGPAAERDPELVRADVDGEGKVEAAELGIRRRARPRSGPWITRRPNAQASRRSKPCG